jgi:hypothetical protein
VITGSQLDVYLKYSGDSDGWARSASSEEKKLIDDSQWAEIDSLRLEGLLKREQLAEASRKRLLDSLGERVADEDVLRRLQAIA